MIEQISVPAHVTQRLTTRLEWVFTRVRTGCVRVQLGEFCAYLQTDEAEELADFIQQTRGVGK